jgi:hypothetical protein
MARAATLRSISEDRVVVPVGQKPPDLEAAFGKRKCSCSQRPSVSLRMGERAQSEHRTGRQIPEVSVWTEV